MSWQAGFGVLLSFMEDKVTVQVSELLQDKR